jgi:branched-subunit amino acid transport protein
LSLWQPKLWVAIPTFIFAFKTKSLGGTVVIGMALFWLVQTIM